MPLRPFPSRARGSPFVTARSPLQIVLSQDNPNGAATVRERGLVQREFLDSPVGQLAHKKFVGITAIDAVDRTEFLDQLAGPPESTHDLAIELHLINLAVIQIARVVRIGAVQKLVCP